MLIKKGREIEQNHHNNDENADYCPNFTDLFSVFWIEHHTGYNLTTFKVRKV